MENKCERYDEMIFEYAEGGLSPELRAEIEAHFSGCADCSEKFAEAERLLSEIKESRYSAPDDLLPGVIAAVKEEEADRKMVRAMRSKLIRRTAAVAAAVVLAVGIIAAVRTWDNGLTGSISGAGDVKSARDDASPSEGKDDARPELSPEYSAGKAADNMSPVPENVVFDKIADGEPEPSEPSDMRYEDGEMSDADPISDGKNIVDGSDTTEDTDDSDTEPEADDPANETT